MQTAQNQDTSGQDAVVAHVANTALQVKKPFNGNTATPSSGMGGGGYHPSVAKHLQQSKPLGMGGGGYHPSIAKHLQSQTKV